MTPGLIPIVSNEPDGIHTEVLWVDQYGNAQINLDPNELEVEEADTNHFGIKIAEQNRIAKRVETFEDLSVGELGLTVDSYGLVALVIGRGSAAEEMKIRTGDQIVISFSDTSTTQSVPVVLKELNENDEGES